MLDDRMDEAIALMDEYFMELEDLNILDPDIESINPMEIFMTDVDIIGLNMAIIKVRNFIREKKEANPTFKRYKKAEDKFFDLFSDQDKWVELWI